MIYCYPQSIFTDEKKVKKFLCPIGKGVLKDPIFTKCGHLFCLECIKSYLNFSTKKQILTHIENQNLEEFEANQINPEIRSNLNSYLDEEEDEEYSDEENYESPNKIEKACPLCKSAICFDSLVKAFVVNNFLLDEIVICASQCGWTGELSKLKEHKENLPDCSIKKIEELEICVKDKNKEIEDLKIVIEDLKYEIQKKNTFLINCSLVNSKQKKSEFFVENALKICLPFELKFLLRESSVNFEIGIFEKKCNFFVHLNNEGVISCSFLEENKKIEVFFNISSICELLVNFKIVKDNKVCVNITKDNKNIFNESVKFNKKLQDLRFSTYIKSYKDFK